MAQLLTTRVPTLKIAEPLFDEMTHSFKHNSPERFTKPYSRPCVIVSPEIATLPLPIRYTWLESLPLTARAFAPGPLTVIVLSIDNSLLSAMVPPTSGANIIVSPSDDDASRMA